MDVVFKKSQLNLIREFLDGESSSQQKPAIDVSNSEGDSDPSALRSDAEKAAQFDSNNYDKSINVSSYTNNHLQILHRI